MDPGPRPRPASKRIPPTLAAIVLATLAASRCGPATAQVAGRIGVQSDYEVRGASVSRNRPVGMLDMSYDSLSGVYLNGVAFGALPDHGYAGLVGIIGNLGYVRRLNLEVSVDAGVSHTEYINVGPTGYRVDYTELYAGLASRRLSARLYYSPDYFRSGDQTLYGEVAGGLDLPAGFRLNAHVGLLGYLDRAAGYPPERIQYDWLVAASRQFGSFDVRVAVSGGGPGRNTDYYYPPRAGTEVVIGAGYAF